MQKARRHWRDPRHRRGAANRFKMQGMQTKPPSPHPSLDRFKTELAGMSPEQRRQAFLLLAQLVKQRVHAATEKP